MTSSYRVLAFDPGFERLGVAVLERAEGSTKDTLLFSDCVRTSATEPLEQRLRLLGEAVEVNIKKWKPQAIALEDVYFENNAKSAMQVAQVRGVLAYLTAKHGLLFFHYTPPQVKIAVTGYGRSDKKSVTTMVERLVQVPPKKGRLDDELDAIAVGITCLASTAHRYPHPSAH